MRKTVLLFILGCFVLAVLPTLARNDGQSPATGNKVQKPGEVRTTPDLNQPGPGWQQEDGWTNGLVNGTAPDQSAPALEPVPDQQLVGPRLQLGPLDILPRMRLGATYDDNIFISDTNEVDDFLFVISPGFILGLGDSNGEEFTFARLEYIPSFILFQDHCDLDSIDHHVLFSGQYQITRLTLGGGYEFEKLSGSDREVGDRVNRDIHTGRLEAGYVISDKTSVDADGVVSVRDYERQLDSTEFVNHNWLNYHFTPKVNMAAGAAFGFVQPDRSSDQTYQQALVRLRYESTAKVSFNGNAGVEFRQYDSAVSDRCTPIFGLGAEYRFSEGTRFSLNASRRVISSAIRVGENYTATRVAGKVEQHLWRDFFLDLEGGFENAKYERAISGAQGTREDDYFFIRPQLNCRLQDWLSLSAFYLFRENDSNQSSESFQNNQCGIELAFGF